MSHPVTIKIRYRHWAFRLPLLRHYRAICLGRLILFKDGEGEIPEALLRHEMAHQGQIARDGRFGFYSRYLWEYVRNLCQCRDHWRAYREISYEIEARAAEQEPPAR